MASQMQQDGICVLSLELELVMFQMFFGFNEFILYIKRVFLFSCFCVCGFGFVIVFDVCDVWEQCCSCKPQNGLRWTEFSCLVCGCL